MIIFYTPFLEMKQLGNLSDNHKEFTNVDLLLLCTSNELILHFKLKMFIFSYLRKI